MKERYVLIKEKFNKIDKNYILIFIIAISIFIPYISKGIIRGDDYICHISNLYAIDKSTSLNIIESLFNKINPIMANNMGYGNAIFYPQLSYWGTIAIHMIMNRIGFSLVSSIKIFEFFTIFLAGIMMYKLMKLIMEDCKVSLASAIIYMCSPYFLNYVFLRMAYSEMLVFVFMPIVFIAIYDILNKEYKKFIKFFIVGYCGMIFSHLVLTLFFTILLMIVLLVNIKDLLNKKCILSFLIASFLILGITSSFIVPMLEHKINGQYVVFQPEGMANIEKLHTRRLDLSNLFLNINASKPKYVSIVTSIMTAIAVLTFKKIMKNKILKRFFISVGIFTLLSIIMTLKVINWNYVPKILWNIQFPWRMCTFITFGFSIMAGISIKYFKNEEIQKLLLLVICIIMLMDASRITHLKTINENEEILIEEVSSLRNEACGKRKEYLPVKAKENIEYLKYRKQEILIKKGKIQNSEILENNTPYLKFLINTNKDESSVIEIPRLYYLGYTITLQTEDGKNEKISYYENENGFIEFEVNKSGIIKVQYKGTTLHKITYLISIVSIAIFIIIIFRKGKEIDIYQ